MKIRKFIVLSLVTFLVSASVGVGQIADVTAYQMPELVRQINLAFDSIEDGTIALDVLSITTDDFNMDGSATDTLQFDTVAGQVTNQINYNLYARDGAAMSWQLNATNNTAESVVWHMQVVVYDDTTTNTEDSAYELYVMIGGVITKVLDLDAVGAEFGTLKVFCTAADLGDGDLDNVGQISADSLIADGSALAIGDNSETVAINSSDWDIDASGNAGGFGTFSADGDVDLSETGGSSGSADLDVAGYAQFAGVAEFDANLLAHGNIVGDAASEMTNFARVYVTTSFEGAIGAGTPAAGSFSTLGATGAATLSGGGTMTGTFAGGTYSNIQALWVGAVQWDDGSSQIDGEQIADNTIDDDSPDWGYGANQIGLDDIPSDEEGAVVAAAGSVAESIGQLHSTVISMTNVQMVATDGSDEGESTKTYDVADGAITILGAVANMSCVTSAGSTNTFVMACGSAAAGDDSALTGTEANIIPSTSLDTTAGTVLTNAFDAILAAPVTIDGTSTAMDIYVNFAIDDDDMDADTTNTVTGDLTVYWVNAGDNQ